MTHIVPTALATEEWIPGQARDDGGGCGNTVRVGLGPIAIAGVPTNLRNMNAVMIAIGLALGVAVGAAFDNIAMGIGVGLVIGIAIDVARRGSSRHK